VCGSCALQCRANPRTTLSRRAQAAGWSPGILLRPLQSQGEDEVSHPALLQEGGELEEGALRVPQFETQAAAELDIVLDGGSPGAHRAPPGHATAKGARTGRSTLA
jgi:hypothetical protein